MGKDFSSMIYQVAYRKTLFFSTACEQQQLLDLTVLQRIYMQRYIFQE